MSADHFIYKAPREYARKIENWLGTPSVVGKNLVLWDRDNTPKPYQRIYVRDEYIPHKFPASHHDFVYSVAKISLTPKQACDLLKVSGSILPDLLKGEVGARCGDLKANDVTLSFVKDVVNRKTSPTKTEYARRIKNGVVTRKEFDSYKMQTFNSELDDCILY